MIFAGSSALYGVLWGIFNIKRELRSQEVGKLRQDIYALENEQKELDILSLADVENLEEEMQNVEKLLQ